MPYALNPSLHAFRSTQYRSRSEDPWCVIVHFVAQGPKDTPYEGGVFEVLVNVPEQYPLVPPAVRYRTKIFHPNVHFKVTGHIGYLAYKLEQFNLQFSIRLQRWIAIVGRHYLGRQMQTILHGLLMVGCSREL